MPKLEIVYVGSYSFYDNPASILQCTIFPTLLWIALESLQTILFGEYALYCQQSLYSSFSMIGDYMVNIIS